MVWVTIGGEPAKEIGNQPGTLALGQQESKVRGKIGLLTSELRCVPVSIHYVKCISRRKAQLVKDYEWEGD